MKLRLVIAFCFVTSAFANEHCQLWRVWARSSIETFQKSSDFNAQTYINEIIRSQQKWYLVDEFQRILFDMEYDLKTQKDASKTTAISLSHKRLKQVLDYFDPYPREFEIPDIHNVINDYSFAAVNTGFRYRGNKKFIEFVSKKEEEILKKSNEIDSQLQTGKIDTDLAIDQLRVLAAEKSFLHEMSAVAQGDLSGIPTPVLQSVTYPIRETYFP